MHNATILVTGGAGYIGSHTALALLEQGFQVVIFDNLSESSLEVVQKLHPATFVEGDLLNPADLATCFETYSISAVIHFAARAYVGESVTDPALYYQNNVAGSLNLLRAMHDHGVTCLVMSSTCATYGNPEQLPITESTPQEPLSPYGRSKYFVERMIHDFAEAYGLRAVIFRYFNAAGADPDGRIGESHSPETHIIPLVLLTALGRRPMFSIFGNDYPTADGTCIRDFVHVTDLADAHVKGLHYLLNGGTTAAFNLGSQEGHSVNDIIHVARSITQREIKTRIAARRPGDPPRLVADAQQAKAQLGWEPRHSDIRTIIQHAWNWLKKQ